MKKNIIFLISCFLLLFMINMGDVHALDYSYWVSGADVKVESNYDDCSRFDVGDKKISLLTLEDNDNGEFHANLDVWNRAPIKRNIYDNQIVTNFLNILGFRPSYLVRNIDDGENDTLIDPLTKLEVTTILGSALKVSLGIIKYYIVLRTPIDEQGLPYSNYYNGLNDVIKITNDEGETETIDLVGVWVFYHESEVETFVETSKNKLVELGKDDEYAVMAFDTTVGASCYRNIKHELKYSDEYNEEEMEVSCVTLFGDKNDPDSLSHLINEILLYVKIIVPILVIVLGIIDLSKAVISKEENMKKHVIKFIKRLIIGVAIFFVPVLIDVLMSWANIIWEGSDYYTCNM